MQITHLPKPAFSDLTLVSCVRNFPVGHMMNRPCVTILLYNPIYTEQLPQDSSCFYFCPTLIHKLHLWFYLFSLPNAAS